MRLGVSGLGFVNMADILEGSCLSMVEYEISRTLTTTQAAQYTGIELGFRV